MIEVTFTEACALLGMRLGSRAEIEAVAAGEDASAGLQRRLNDRQWLLEHAQRERALVACIEETMPIVDVCASIAEAARRNLAALDAQFRGRTPPKNAATNEDKA